MDMIRAHLCLCDFDLFPFTQRPQNFSYLQPLFTIEDFPSIFRCKNYMLVEIPPKYSVSSFMGYLKGKSSLMIYEKYPELKYKYRKAN